MITRDNYKNYAELFAKINGILEKSSEILSFKYNGEIKDINDYFMELKNIKDCVINADTLAKKGVTDVDPSLLILPLEEGLFEIDANTRKIDIPADFNRNGVGVQGDELAEIVYFSIDRYFDVTDLYDKDIFVQWEAPNGDKGLSVTINKTLNYKAGKVVFGWPITQEMTKNSGNLKFAVRFYARGKDDNDNPILTYSFGTLVSTIKINSGLEFDIADPDLINKMIINKNQMIYDSLRASTAIGIDVPAVAPTFDETAFVPLDRDKEYDAGEVFKGHALFTRDDAPAGTGIISYSWVRQDDNDDVEQEFVDVPEYQEIAAGTPLTSSIENYWIKKDEKYIIYNGADLVAPSEPVLYKRFGTLAPAKAGYYYLVAINDAGRGNSNKSKTTKPWIIAFAKKPQFSGDAMRRAIIQLDSGKALITVPVSVADNGKLTYQWQYSNSATGNFEDIKDKIDKSMEATNEGYYRLHATNSHNQSETSAVSEPIRVTYPPDRVQNVRFKINDDDTEYSQDSDTAYISDTATLKVIYDKPSYSDNLKFKWYKGQKEELIEGEETPELRVTPGAAYFVVITNEYNGETIDSSRRKIVIMT